MSDTRTVRRGRQRWQRSAWAGGGLGMVLQFWMLTAGTGDLLRWERSGNFYDVQARSMLQGRLAVDARVLGIESFARDDQTYMYFGPFPALIRVPVIAVTNQLDGQLSALSMLLAVGLVLAATVWLGWRLRHAVRGNAPVERPESTAAFFTVLGVIGGSSLLFAASRTWVYHEAIAWGVALTLWSWIFLLRWLWHDGARWLVAASLVAALAMLTRPSVGGAAVAAIGWVLVRRVVAAARERAMNKAIGRGLFVATGAMLAPVVAYATVNWLKFRRLFSIPFDQQGFTLIDPQRQAMLAANDGNYFSVANVPTNFVHYFRPDSPRLGTRWPFVHFEPSQFTIGDRTYDLIDVTGGIPIVMPIAIVACLFAVGAFAHARLSRLAAVRVLLAGGVIGTFPVLGIAYIANRYHSDFLPLLVLLILVGVPAGFEVASRRSVGPRVVVRTVVALTFVGMLTNGALAYTYQQAYSPNAGADRLAAYVGAQRNVADAFGTSRGNVWTGTDLPPAGQLDDLFIIGDCDAMYWSDGQATNAVKLSNWNAVERTSGVLSGTISFPRNVGTITTVLATTSAGDTGVQLPERINPATIDRSSEQIFVVIDHRRAVMNFGVSRSGDRSTGQRLGPDVAVPFGKALGFEVVADPRVGILEVVVDEQVVLTSGYFGGPDLVLVPGLRNARRGAASILLEPIQTPVCDRLFGDPLDRVTSQ